MPTKSSWSNSSHSVKPTKIVAIIGMGPSGLILARSCLALYEVKEVHLFDSRASYTRQQVVILQPPALSSMSLRSVNEVMKKGCDVGINPGQSLHAVCQKPKQQTSKLISIKLKDLEDILYKDLFRDDIPEGFRDFLYVDKPRRGKLVIHRPSTITQFHPKKNELIYSQGKTSTSLKYHYLFLAVGGGIIRKLVFQPNHPPSSVQSDNHALLTLLRNGNAQVYQHTTHPPIHWKLIRHQKNKTKREFGGLTFPQNKEQFRVRMLPTKNGSVYVALQMSRAEQQQLSLLHQHMNRFLKWSGRHACFKANGQTKNKNCTVLNSSTFTPFTHMARSVLPKFPNIALAGDASQTKHPFSGESLSQSIKKLDGMVDRMWSFWTTGNPGSKTSLVSWSSPNIPFSEKLIRHHPNHWNPQCLHVNNENQNECQLFWRRDHRLIQTPLQKPKVIRQKRHKHKH